MTEQKLREKIIETLEKGGRNFLKSKETKVSIYEYYADALIAEGIGNVSEYKHRAEVSERALDKATELAYEYRTEADTLSCSSCPMSHIFDSCKERGLYKDCAKRWKEELLKQAEKELEEKKDD